MTSESCQLLEGYDRTNLYLLLILNYFKLNTVSQLSSIPVKKYLFFLAGKYCEYLVRVGENGHEGYMGNMVRIRILGLSIYKIPCQR